MTTRTHDASELAHIHRLSPWHVRIGRDLKLGRQIKGEWGKVWRFSDVEKQLIEEEVLRRKSEYPDRRQQRRAAEREEQRSQFELALPEEEDPLDVIERVLFRAALELTELAVSLHKAASLLKLGRLEWEKAESRRARAEGIKKP